MSIVLSEKSLVRFSQGTDLRGEGGGLLRPKIGNFDPFLDEKGVFKKKGEILR